MRRPLLAAALAVALLPLRARADIPPPPPPQHPVGPSVTGLDSSVTTTGAPDHAMFDVHNPTGAAVTLDVARIVLAGAHETSLAVRVLQAPGGTVRGSVVRVPPRSTVRLTVGFSGVPASVAAAQAYDFVLHGTLAGRAVAIPVHVARAIREPLHDVVITS